MSVNSGCTTKIGVGIESAFGEKSPIQLLAPVQPSDGINASQEITGIEAIAGNCVKNKDFYRGVRTFEGGYEMALYPDATGYFLSSLLGLPITTGTEPYLHTFTEAGDKVSLTVEELLTDFYKEYFGFMVGSMTLSGAVGEVLNWSISGQGKTSADTSGSSAGVEASQPLVWSDIVDIALGVENVACYVRDFSIEFTNNLQSFHSLCDIEPTAMYHEGAEVSGSFTLMLDSNTAGYYQNYLDGETKEITMIIQGANNTGLEIIIQRAAFSTFTTSINNEFNAVTVEFMGISDDSGFLATYVLANSTADYIRP